MNDTGEDHLPPGWVERKMAALRRLLDEAGAWPAGADALAADLLGHAAPFEPDEVEQMLSIVIDDALNGIDISERYPTFYRLLAHTPALQDAFLEGLNAAESVEASELPQAPSRDLSFLPRSQAQAVVTPLGTNHWRVAWRRTVAQLEELLRPMELGRVYRNDLWAEDDGWQSLLRSEVLLGEIELDVLLEARQPARRTEPVPLALTVTRVRPENGWPDIDASVEWGNYRFTMTGIQEGRNTLQALQPGLVLNEDGQTFRAGLRLTLEVRTPARE